MSDYVSIADLVGLPGLSASRRQILRIAKHWPSRPRQARGGGREYPISCLPPETQAALLKILSVASSGPASAAPLMPGGSLPAAGQSFSASELLPHQVGDAAAVYESKSKRAKSEAQARLQLVVAYRAARAAGQAPQDAAAVVAAQGGVNTATLRRWQRRIAGQPESAWLALLTPHHAGGQVKIELLQDAWDMLRADYLRAERPSANSCIARLRRAAAAHGWELPSNRTIVRRLKGLPRAAVHLARGGEKAVEGLYPAQVRDRTALHALAIVNADGYQHNVWVEFPDGEVCRPKTWYWQDVYSSKILAWRTDKTEHTDQIRLSFGDLVERWGIPGRVLVDNTLAAANKTMTGGARHRFRFKVQVEEPMGVFQLLTGRDPMFSTPGHGQAKPIERAFGVGGLGEVVDKHPSLTGCWTGSSTLDKPEYAGRKAQKSVPLEQFEALLQTEIAAWNAKPGRRSAIARGRSHDDVFSASYAEIPIHRATEEQRRWWLLATEPVKCNAKHGGITLDTGRHAGRGANQYWSPVMVDYAGQRVVAKFDPARLHEGVHIYSYDGRYLCWADCHEPAGFDDADKARAHMRERRKFIRASKEALSAERRMDAIEAAKFLPATPPAPEAAHRRSNVIAPVFRDPLERPAPAAAELTPEQQALAREIEAELAEGAPKVQSIEKPETRYARWVRLDERLQAGGELDERERSFHAAYGHSTEWNVMKALFEDFGLQVSDYVA